MLTCHLQTSNDASAVLVGFTVLSCLLYQRLILSMSRAPTNIQKGPHNTAGIFMILSQFDGMSIRNTE